MTQPRQTLRPSLRPVLEAYVSVTGAAFTAKAGDRVIGVNRAGIVTVTLPTAQLRPGRIYTVKDESGAAAANNITVATEGSETIDGSATDVINIDYESKSYYSDGTNWFILPVTPDTNTQLTLATTVSTQDHGGPAAPGSASTASKGDHKHGMPAGGAGGLTWVGGTTTEATTTSTSKVDLITISSLSIPAATPITYLANWRKTSGATGRFDTHLKLNSTEIADSVFLSSTTDQAENGVLQVLIAPRVTNYLRGYRALVGAGVTSAQNIIDSFGGTDMPTATITSLILQGLIGSASITVGFDEVHVYTLATS